MRRLLPLSSVVVLAMGSLFCATIANAEEAMAGKAVTLKGQVIDLACYMGMGMLGGDHQKCAEMCVGGGASIGYKTAEKLYVVLIDPMHDKEGMFKKLDLPKFVNKNSTVTGKVIEKDGVAMVMIASIE